ncbi:MAG: polysaccharide biosynthesis tyrosine autokinase [Bacteroidaceae bacterium]|nr:polysaccharide biosynthesis tyrosine autokinase [Bacteroidaceae bacterium]
MKNEEYNDIFNDGNKPVDYKTIIFEYLLYWPVIAVCLVLSIAAAYTHLRYKTPVYKVASTVLIKQGDKSKTTSIAQLAGVQDLGTFSMANNFDNEVEIIQSYTLIKKVVNTLGLYINHELDNKLRYNLPLYKNSPIQVWMSPDDAENLPSLLEVQLGTTAENKISATVTYTDLENIKQTMSKAFEEFPAVFITPVGNLSFTCPKDTLSPEELAALPSIKATIAPPSIVADGYKASLSATPTTEFTSIVQLLIYDTNRQRGIDFLNTLVAIYNNEANEDKNQVAMRTAEFIDERIRVINQELSTTESELADYKQRAGLTDLSTNAQIALRENSEYDQKRAENTNQLRLISHLRDYIENPENNNEVIPANVGLTDAALVSVISQYNEMIIERKRLLRTSKANNPVVINLDASIAATRNTVLATVESIEKGLQITRNNLDIEAGKYRTKISNAPKQERELLDISRQQEIKANLYLMLLQKREENAITLAAKANNGRIVEEARAGKFMVSPNKRNTYMVAILLGLMFPIGCIWLKRALRFKLEGRTDVQDITDAPIVGDIPQVKGNKERNIVVRENHNGLMEETFRNLRTNLQYMLKEEEKVILFTSTTAREGKTFNAANLATSFAYMGKKVVIVGLDIRNPSLTKVFGIDKKEHGITEYLAAPTATDLMSNCYTTNIPNLYVLPCGTVPPNPTELVARPSLDKAIETLKEQFDYVILDTAPIGMVTDTRLITRVADLCVYVCRVDYTRKNEFELVKELQKREDLPTLGILINGIDMDNRKNGYYYGYGRYAKYGKYGYARKYGHSYGYTKDKE